MRSYGWRAFPFAVRGSSTLNSSQICCSFCFRVETKLDIYHLAVPRHYYGRGRGPFIIVAVALRATPVVERVSDSVGRHSLF